MLYGARKCVGKELINNFITDHKSLFLWSVYSRNIYENPIICFDATVGWL